MLLALCLPLSTFAAPQPKEYHALDQDITNSIEWADHIKIEIAKGKNMNVAHAQEELTHLQGWLEKVENSYAELAKQPAAEVLEGHFLAVKQHEEAALTLSKKLSAEFAKTNKDRRAMKKVIKQIQNELVATSREHRAELNEIEKH